MIGLFLALSVFLTNAPAIAEKTAPQPTAVYIILDNSKTMTPDQRAKAEAAIEKLTKRIQEKHRELGISTVDFVLADEDGKILERIQPETAVEKGKFLLESEKPSTSTTKPDAIKTATKKVNDRIYRERSNHRVPNALVYFITDWDFGKDPEPAKEKLDFPPKIRPSTSRPNYDKFWGGVRGNQTRNSIQDMLGDSHAGRLDFVLVHIPREEAKPQLFSDVKSTGQGNIFTVLSIHKGAKSDRAHLHVMNSDDYIELPLNSLPIWNPSEKIESVKPLQDGFVPTTRQQIVDDAIKGANDPKSTGKLQFNPNTKELVLSGTHVFGGGDTKNEGTRLQSDLKIRNEGVVVIMPGGNGAGANVERFVNNGTVITSVKREADGHTIVLNNGKIIRAPNEQISERDRFAWARVEEGFLILEKEEDGTIKEATYVKDDDLMKIAIAIRDGQDRNEHINKYPKRLWPIIFEIVLGRELSHSASIAADSDIGFGRKAIHTGISALEYTGAYRLTFGWQAYARATSEAAAVGAECTKVKEKLSRTNLAKGLLRWSGGVALTYDASKRLWVAWVRNGNPGLFPGLNDVPLDRVLNKGWMSNEEIRKKKADEFIRKLEDTKKK